MIIANDNSQFFMKYKKALITRNRKIIKAKIAFSFGKLHILRSAILSELCSAHLRVYIPMQFSLQA